MHKRRPKAMRGKGMKAYCRMIEKRDRILRQRVRASEQGADEIHALLNAILAAVTDRFGNFDIEMPKVGRSVTVERKDDRLFISLRREESEKSEKTEEMAEKPVIEDDVTVEKTDSLAENAENTATREPDARGDLSCQEGISTKPT